MPRKARRISALFLNGTQQNFPEIAVVTMAEKKPCKGQSDQGHRDIVAMEKATVTTRRNAADGLPERVDQRQPDQQPEDLPMQWS